MTAGQGDDRVFQVDCRRFKGPFFKDKDAFDSMAPVHKSSFQSCYARGVVRTSMPSFERHTNVERQRNNEEKDHGGGNVVGGGNEVQRCGALGMTSAVLVFGSVIDYPQRDNPIVVYSETVTAGRSKRSRRHLRVTRAVLEGSTLIMEFVPFKVPSRSGAGCRPIFSVKSQSGAQEQGDENP